MELNGASVAGKSGGFHQENQNTSQAGTSKASTTRKLSVKLNYMLDLSDYSGMSNVLSNACIVQCLL